MSNRPKINSSVDIGFNPRKTFPWITNPMRKLEIIFSDEDGVRIKTEEYTDPSDLHSGWNITYREYVLHRKGEMIDPAIFYKQLTEDIPGLSELAVVRMLLDFEARMVAKCYIETELEMPDRGFFKALSEPFEYVEITNGDE